MNEEKSFWRKFNPTLKEMMEKNPDFSVLGIWWAGYWRLMVLLLAVGIGLAILAKIFS
jgi:hypothetical protein